MSEQIYVALLDEGVPVWRPAPAWKIDQSTYIVLRPDDFAADDEKWEFPPGSTVVCEPRRFSDGTEALVAIKLKNQGRQTA